MIPRDGWKGGTWTCGQDHEKFWITKSRLEKPKEYQ